ncbi:TPA: hypothetical protein RTG66_001569 [Campylobacter jejuni]|nr:hypothetical protein [Campylobacter jejuni]
MKKQVKQEVEVRTLKEAGYYRDTSNNVYYLEAGTDIEQYIESKNLIPISYEKALELTAPSFDDFKDYKISQIKLYFLKNMGSSLNFEGNIFDCDDKSLNTYKNLLELNKKNYDIITSDNKIIKLSKEKLENLKLAIIENLYNQALENRKFKDSINKAKSIDKINFLLNEKGIKID